MDYTDTIDTCEFVDSCVEPEKDTSLLLQYLIQIQYRYNFVPEDAISQLQHSLDLDVAHIKSVISFYSFLNSSFQGHYRILFSDNITDRMLGNQSLYEQLKTSLKNHKVDIGFTSCTGFCDQGPAMLVNGMAINKLDSKRITQIADLIQNNQPLELWPEGLFVKEENIQRSDIQFNSKAGDGKGIEAALENGSDAILKILNDSGLRGRGGAGFYTAKKWQFCKQAISNQHYVVCNADEGEPGTFKDRVLLSTDAHSVIEGMTICAAVIGATKGLIYLRGEYRFLVDKINEVLQKRRTEGLLGQNILGHQGFNFDIEIHLGAGAYICGEESALIESLEGKRGIPRVRPPFPVVDGYKNKPTVVNNVETFWSVSRIIVNGSHWFTRKGTPQSTGTRLLSISGDCERPGIYEYPFGTTLTEILKDCGGSDAQAVQMAGAAGTTVVPSGFDRAMSNEDLSTGGSFMVLGPQRNLMDLLQNFAQFFKHESCGFCTPCRVGTSVIADVIQRFKNAQGCEHDLKQLRDVCGLMNISCFCGLGCTVPTVFLDALNQHSQMFKDLMKTDSSTPCFNLEESVSEFKQITNPSGRGL